MNVLLVEDDLDLCDALSRVLLSRGFQIVCCSTGLEGLALARRRSFDALILDLSLPGMMVLISCSDCGMGTPPFPY